MGRLDNEENIIKDMHEVPRSNTTLLTSSKFEKMLVSAIMKEWPKWTTNNGHSSEPPDFFSRDHKLMFDVMRINGNVKKCAVGKHPKSEKHGNTAQFSEVERSGTQENCGGIGSGCRLRLRPLPVLRRRQPKRVACIDPDAVVVDKNIAKNDRFDLFSRQLVRRDLIDLLFLERGEKALHPCVVEAMSGAAEALYHAAARQLGTKG